jgi:site-specific DNA-cytosine methylase
MVALHPAPLARPITFREATKELLDLPEEPRLLSDFVKEYAKVHPGGWSTNPKIYKKLKGKLSGSLDLKWAQWNQTIGTILKSEIGQCGIVHPEQKRYLSIQEVKACGSFPQDYKFKDRKEAFSRIGNAVPPKLMEAIANHLKNNFLKKENPTVISTFAGGGGSSLGYHYAKYNELLAVEWDGDAVNTLKENLPELDIYHGDIANLSEEECLERVKLKKGELDLFDGSPPCQGFSTSGKRQLTDKRNNLFIEYVRLLRGLYPKMFIMENVTGLIKGHMRGKFLEIISALRIAGYHVESQVMDAKYYNVPQSRKRVIFIGIRKDL